MLIMIAIIAFINSSINSYILYILYILGALTYFNCKNSLYLKNNILLCKCN